MPEPSPHNTYARPPGDAGEDPVIDPASIEGLYDATQGEYARETPVGIPDELLEKPPEEEKASPEPRETKETKETAPDIESLRKDIESLRETVSRPQQGIRPDDLTRSFAEALTYAQRQNQPREEWKPPEPPSFFDASLDPLMDEPGKLREAIDSSNKKAASWAYEQARNDLAQAYQQQLEGTRQLGNFVGQVAPVIEEIARSRAEEFGKAQGFFADDEHQKEVMTRAAQLVEQQSQSQDPTFRYKTEGWKAALQYLATSEPSLVKKGAKAPPSAGEGDADRKPGGMGKAPLNRHPAALLAAQLAGRKPTEDELQNFFREDRR